MTQAIVAAASAYARADTEIVGCQPDWGPVALDGYTDGVLAAAAVVEKLASSSAPRPMPWSWPALGIPVPRRCVSRAACLCSTFDIAECGAHLHLPECTSTRMYIYRKYYGGKVALYILGTFYVTMAAAGYVVEVVFGGLGIIPTQRATTVFTAGASLNYTTVLNVVFLALAAVLVWRFMRTGGPEMLRMMDGPTSEHASHASTS